jgi:hypothetical protein
MFPNDRGWGQPPNLSNGKNYYNAHSKVNAGPLYMSKAFKSIVSTECGRKLNVRPCAGLFSFKSLSTINRG